MVGRVSSGCDRSTRRGVLDNRRASCNSRRDRTANDSAASGGDADARDSACVRVQGIPAGAAAADSSGDSDQRLRAVAPPFSGVRGGVGGSNASRSGTRSRDLRNVFSDRTNRTALRRDAMRSSRYDVSRFVSRYDVEWGSNADEAEAA